MTSRLPDTARRYGAAFADRRRLRSLSVDVGFDEALGHARDWFGITQQPEEARRLWALVRTLEPKSVLEIGLDTGGTFFLWTRAAAPDALLIAIDTRPAGKLGRWSPFQLSRRSFARGNQRIRLLLGRDSHSEETVGTVRSILANGRLDFLFIDGDHSYAGVRADFELYAPLVRPGGIVALHDIWPASRSEGTCPPNDGVVEFWRELASKFETEEFVDRSPDGFGIGVVHVAE
jgi:predicted O-methyltransferase YrrM